MVMRLVKGSGPLDAKIVIVGEAPGREEEARGEPFIGASGRLLTSMLSEVGIDRAMCRLENVMQRRPKGNSFGEFYEDKRRREPSQELVLGRARLMRDIGKIKPNIIIALGAEPLKALTGKPNITQWRGSILETSVGKVIGTFHPAGILREYKNRVVATLDLKRALEESLTRKAFLPTVACYINPTFKEALEWLDELKKAKRVSFDIETSQRHVRCVGFSSNKLRAYCIPLISKTRRFDLKSTIVQMTDAKGRSCWSLEEEMEILKSMKELLEDESIEKVAQNFPFDSRILAEDLGIDVRGLWMDTMLVHHACYCEMLKSLDFLTSIYT